MLMAMYLLSKLLKILVGRQLLQVLLCLILQHWKVFLMTVVQFKQNLMHWIFLVVQPWLLPVIFLAEVNQIQLHLKTVNSLSVMMKPLIGKSKPAESGFYQAVNLHFWMRRCIRGRFRFFIFLHFIIQKMNWFLTLYSVTKKNVVIICRQLPMFLDANL